MQHGSVAASGFPAFVCPRCRGGLRREPDAFHCAPCAATYPVVLGIADFRLFADPWIGIEEDREKGRRLEAETAGQDFAATVRAYWAMTPGTPRALAERFTERVLAAEERAEDWLDWMADEDPVTRQGVWLDVGCGTADLAAAITRRGGSVIAVDIAFRWLVVARKRPSLDRARTLLVCANGEHLPFGNSVVERVVTAGTLEHCADASRVVSEARRVLVPLGAVRLRTVNRYSLLREPHVGLWGVGFVPRRWADAFVRWRSGQRYLHHHPLSQREIRRDLLRAGFGAVRVEASPLLAADRRHLRGAWQWAGRAYAAVRRWPLLGTGLAWIAPELEARGVTPSPDRPHSATLT